MGAHAPTFPRGQNRARAVPTRLRHVRRFCPPYWFNSNGPRHVNWTKLRKAIFSWTVLRGFISVAGLIAFWEVGRRLHLPGLAAVPAPSEVYGMVATSVTEAKFWEHWQASFTRVMTGFVIAQIVGIPLGLMMAMSRVFHATTFPLLEIMRPIPPLAWVPAAIIFWPTQELSIVFVTFLGAFYTVVINVIDGAQTIDLRYYQAARSMGSSSWDVFRRIILPGTVPSIVVGATVGIGIAWAVVVAAEMISGGGSAGSMGGAKGGGLGFFIWNSYVGGSYTQIVVGMISIGIAGYISSALLRKLGELVTPWLREQ
jgi:NitT/TauT family transport system permease protein